MKNSKNLVEIKSKQKAELILSNPIFQKKAHILRIKWKIPKGGFLLPKPTKIKTGGSIMIQHRTGEMGEWENWLARSGKSPNFWKDLDNIRRTTLKPYKLPDQWLFFLYRYIVYGSKMPAYGPEVHSRRDDDTGEYSLWIKIDGDTTLNDIKRVWKYIKGEQKRLPDYKQRFKTIKKLPRDKRIIELSKQKLTDKKIVEQIKKEFGESLTYLDIPKIRHKYKKRHHL